MNAPARAERLAELVNDVTAPASWRIGAALGRLPEDAMRVRPWVFGQPENPVADQLPDSAFGALRDAMRDSR